MKNICITGIFCFVSALAAMAGPGVEKRPKLTSPVPFESLTQRQIKVARMEAAAMKKPTISAGGQMWGAKKSPIGNSTTNNLSFVDLGVSINPYGTFLNGRNYVSANAALNSIALFRRGWQTDPNPDGGNNGNKLFVDVSTNGGGDWTNSNGPIFTHTIYDTTSNNHGTRYPQGVIFNPSGNTNPQDAILFGNPRILNGSNDAWGGLGLGWKSVGTSIPKRQKLWSSEEQFHFRTESMEVTSQGNVFLVEPEEDLSNGITFTDRIFVYKFTYNSSTNNFDSLVSEIPFPNEGGDYPTQIGGTAISFAPDGLTGFVAMAAFNNYYDSVGAYVPYISKTTDGGQNWSPFKIIPLNHPYQNFTSPGLDGLRNNLFVSDFVRFTGDGEIIPAQRGEEYAHKVDYIVNDIDLTVDSYGFAHILTNVSVSGFGDTLFSVPSGITYYPNYGSWNIDLFIKDLNDEATGFVINKNEGLNGLYGSTTSTADQLIEGNRPQVSRSADGNMIVFCWYDTDLTAHPPALADNPNSNPDLWTMRARIVGPGDVKIDQPRNMTKGSDYDGLAIQGSVSPQLLNAGQGFKLASTIVNLPAFSGSSAVWPTTHVFVNNVSVPSIPDSTNNNPTKFYPVVGNQLVKEGISKTNQLKLYPNPGHGNVLLQFVSVREGQAEITLVDATGRTIDQRHISVYAGDNQLKQGFSNLKTGIYQLKMQMPDGSILIQKIAVQ